MLYIVRTNTAVGRYAIKYSVFVNHHKNKVTANVFTKGMFLCIAEIDELEACVMALRGEQLIKVIALTNIGCEMYDVVVSNRQSIIDMWDSVWNRAGVV